MNSNEYQLQARGIMEGQEHSYLDLTVRPELSKHLLSAAPVVLINAELNAITWTNAAGAKLFGGTGVVQLLAAKLNESQSFTKQLKNAISQMGNSGRIIRGFRLAKDDVSTLLQFEIQSFELSPDEKAFLVINLDEDEDESPAEHLLANNAVQSMEGFADAAAIVDDHGLVVSATKSFGEIGPADALLEKLIAELKLEEDRLIKRPIEAHSGETIIAGFARINAELGRSLVVLARANPVADTAFEGEPDDVPLLDEPTDNHTANSAPSPVDENETDEIAEEEAIHELDNSGQFLTEDTISLEGVSDLNSEEEPTELDATSETSINPEPATPQDRNQTAFQFEKEENSTRFAWTTNNESEFNYVSAELAETVGENAASIVGRKWTDIATVFGFDNNGDIATLLSKQDTWSGKTVLWPIQGTDMSVPIDLAALPIFDSSRSFQGFRGFGIIRGEDTVLDPDETGLALVSNRIHETGSDIPLQEENNSSIETFAEPGIKIHNKEDEEPVSNGSSRSNIVRLVPKSNKPHPNTLSEKENRALEDIRRRLSNDGESNGTSSPPNRRASSGHLDTSLMENLPIAILVYRTDETLYANKEMLDVTGYNTLAELEEAGGIDTILNPGLEGETEPGMQFLIRNDGVRTSIKPILQTVPWAGSKALMLSFASRPEIIVKSDEKFEISDKAEIQSILDTASDGIILTEKDGKIVSFNSSAEVLFGRKIDDVKHKFVWELFANESQSTIKEYIEAISEPGLETLLNDGREVIGIEEQGGTIPLFLTISQLQSSAKRCVILRDMTEWKIAEDELITARRNAEEASEQKSEFLAHVSHEVRTPLNAIIGFSDVMLEERFGPINNPRYREYLRDINRSGSHVLELVNDLLDLSKIEAGKLDLAFEAVDLNKIVSESVALLQPQANSNRVIIRTSLSRAVPKVVADTRSIRQIILNLVSNAIKFSTQNSQVIVSTVYENSGEVALRVRDTGKGMTISELKEAMKPFQQVHKVSDEKQIGTGLGLPLTKALVEANRAHFSIESEPDSGTIANVNFPNQRVLAD